MQSTAATLGLDTSHFLAGGWNKGTGNGRDPVKARAGKQRWYESNRQVYRAANRRRYVEKRREIARLKSVPCTDVLRQLIFLFATGSCSSGVSCHCSLPG